MTYAPTPVSVLVVDDHPFMRRGLAQIINGQPELQVCGEAATAADALQQVHDTQPALAVIDISLGDGNGLELTREIKDRWPNVKVLVCSMHDDALFAERALRAGALGYVNKSEDADTFLGALRRVASGQVYVSPQITERLLTQMVGDSDESVRSPIERLSNRELEVFEMIGRGLGTKQIAAKLELSRKTVETYREHIKAKLNLRNGAELTQHAVQWVLEQPATSAPND
jgi:DNA-binding NarL/FixJ family response regulator